MRRLKIVRRSGSGSTLVEAMTACAITSLFFAGLYQMNWNCMRQLKTSIDGTSASQALLNLEEQFRTSTWNTITVSDSVLNTIMSQSQVADFGHLRKVTETIDVHPVQLVPPYSVMSSPSIQLVRNPDGSVVVTAAGDLSQQSAVRVDITLTWNGLLNQQSHTRAMSLFVSKPGMSGQNLQTQAQTTP